MPVVTLAEFLKPASVGEATTTTVRVEKLLNGTRTYVEGFLGAREFFRAIHGLPQRNILTFGEPPEKVVIPRAHWKALGKFRPLIQKLERENFKFYLKISRAKTEFWARKRYPQHLFRIAYLQLVGTTNQEPIIGYSLILRKTDVLGADYISELINSGLWARLREETPSKERIKTIAQINQKAVLNSIKHLLEKLKASDVYLGKNTVSGYLKKHFIIAETKFVGGIPTWINVRADGRLLRAEIPLDAGFSYSTWEEELKEKLKSLR